MPIPSCGYIFRGQKQVLGRSDYPYFAAMSALESPSTFGPHGKAAVRQWLLGNDVPYARQDYWLEALGGKRTSVAGISGTRYVPDIYQVYAANEMSNAGGVLALGCGLGKTLTAELYAAAVAKKLQGKPVIIATTLTAFGAWEPYIPRFKAMGYSDVFRVSIDSLHKFEPGFPSAGGLLIFDESHLLGSTSARRTKHALALRLKVDDALCLSGTLFHGGIVRALTNMNLAVPGLAGFSSSFNAAEHFHCLKEVYDPQGAKHWKIAKPEGKDFEDFKAFVTARFVCALTVRSPIAAQCVNVPEQDQDTVTFGGPWMDVPTAALHEVRRAIAENEGIPHYMAIMQKLAHEGIGTKAEYILDMLSDGEPLVVFAQYHESLDYLERMFVEEGITYARVDGSVTGAERSGRVDRFQNSDVRVFLGQIEAAGISVELTRATRSVATDISWRPEQYDQALARTCRRGQQYRCRHTDLVANQLQSIILDRIRGGMVFDASVAGFQDVRRASGLGGD